MAPTSKRGCGPWLSGRVANPFGLHDQLPSTRSGDVVDEAMPCGRTVVTRQPVLPVQRAIRPSRQPAWTAFTRQAWWRYQCRDADKLPCRSGRNRRRHHGGTQLVVSIYLTVAGDVSDVIDTIRRLAAGNGSSPAAASNNPGGDPDGAKAVNSPGQSPVGDDASVAEDPWTEELARALWVLLSPGVQEIYRRGGTGQRPHPAPGRPAGRHRGAEPQLSAFGAYPAPLVPTSIASLPNTGGGRCVRSTRRRRTRRAQLDSCGSFNEAAA